MLSVSFPDMPWFSYHGGHSGQFCKHAKGTLGDVVVAAVTAGFTHYGLSEHCPRDREQDLFPGEEQLGTQGLAALFDAYMQEARRLQTEYADRIDLLVGFETERLPPQGWQQRMGSLRDMHNPDFIIGSVHDVDGTYVDFSPERTAHAAEACGGRQALHVKYFEAVADLVTELRPEIVGHIDLVRKFDGAQACIEPGAWAALERALDAVVAVDALLDVNPGSYRKGLSPVYPLPEILRRARAMGIGVTLGDDGHGPHDVGAGLDACLRAIAQAGYREVCYLQRRNNTVERARAALDDVKVLSRA